MGLLDIDILTQPIDEVLLYNNGWTYIPGWNNDDPDAWVKTYEIKEIKKPHYTHFYISITIHKTIDGWVVLLPVIEEHAFVDTIYTLNVLLEKTIKSLGYEFVG